MKLRMLVMVLLTGLTSMSSYAAISRTIDGRVMNTAWMNWTDSRGLPGYDGGGPWGEDSLSAYFTNSNSEVTFVPNSIDDPADYWYIGGGGPGAVGAKTMEAACYNEVVGTLAGEVLTFEGVVTANTLSNTHTFVAFIRYFELDYSGFT